MAALNLSKFTAIAAKISILARAYDFINSSIALLKVTEEIALLLNDHKNNLRLKDFTDFYAREKLKLNDTIINVQLKNIEQAIPTWYELHKSFLTAELKEKYQGLLAQRIQVIFPEHLDF